MYDPAKMRVVSGGTLALAPFNYFVEGNGPDPQNVVAPSGLVKYELLSPSRSTMLIDMLESGKIKVEVFANKRKSEVTGFTSAAKIYVR